MQIFQRTLDLKVLTKHNSAFLFGPRGSGKSFLIRQQLKQEALVINLLNTQDYLRLSENPALLEQQILLSGKSLVVIDEVQKLPVLLDEVHRLIEEKQIRFLLTGSSARKLKRANANMLAGRARKMELYPLTFSEIPNFNLDGYLLWGGLAAVQTAHSQVEFLDSYLQFYLKEEVLAEQVARNLPHFARFLKTAALASGELLNFAKIASDAQLAVSTVKNYYTALEDTLIGTLLEPWTESKKRKAIMTGKFYLFDIGVRHFLLGLNEIVPKTESFGQAFEHFIAMELRALISYHRLRQVLYFWRSVNHHEVDFLLGNQVAIEVKAAFKVTARDAKGLMVLREEGQHKVFVVVSNDPINRVEDHIYYFFWSEFLTRLWGKQAPFETLT